MSQSLADIAPLESVPPSDLVTGERYGERFAKIVRRWAAGGAYTTERVADLATTAALKRSAQLAPAQ